MEQRLLDKDEAYTILGEAIAKFANFERMINFIIIHYIDSPKPDFSSRVLLARNFNIETKYRIAKDIIYDNFPDDKALFKEVNSRIIKVIELRNIIVHSALMYKINDNRYAAYEGQIFDIDKLLFFGNNAKKMNFRQTINDYVEQLNVVMESIMKISFIKDIMGENHAP